MDENELTTAVPKPTPDAMLSALYEESSARLPFSEEKLVYEEFRAININGDLRRNLTQYIQEQLQSSEETRFSNQDIRNLRRGLFFEKQLGLRNDELNKVLAIVTACLPSGISIKPLSDPVWIKIVDVARGLLRTGYPTSEIPGDIAVAEAAVSLSRRGFMIEVANGELALTHDALLRATSLVQKDLDELGFWTSSAMIFHLMRQFGLFHGGQYLPSRVYGLEARQPSLPLNFLFNLAARSPVPQALPKDAPQIFQRAATLAREIAAVIDVEPYSMFEGMNTGPRDMEVFLREMALYDHLFTFRQWPPEHTRFLLKTFFGTDLNELMKNNLGWDIESVLVLYEYCSVICKSDPAAISTGTLQKSELQLDVLNALLPHFAHPLGKVNSEYTSPAQANNINLLFKPLVQVDRDTYMIPALSVASYSFFEAALMPLYTQKWISKGKRDAFIGGGTERTVNALFSRGGILPTFVAAKYTINKEDGECDLVLEDDDTVVFVEFKSKPLTRDAMAGISGGALLDFAGGLLESQIQTMRHERILRSNGSMQFEDGSVLELHGRKVRRMSITLMDLGAIQDRSTFFNLYQSLPISQVSAQPGYSKASQVEDLNVALQEFRGEIKQLEAIGEEIGSQMLTTLSLSIGHLAVLLENIKDLQGFLKRMPLHVSTVSRNPLIEFYRLQKSGITT
jgi:hypothetical protein